MTPLLSKGILPMPKSVLVLLAQADTSAATSTLDPFWTNLWHGFVGSLVFGLLGILLIVLGFKVFDAITTKIDIERELAEKNNVAVAIVCAAMILGVAIIAAVAVH